MKNARLFNTWETIFTFILVFVSIVFLLILYALDCVIFLVNKLFFLHD